MTAMAARAALVLQGILEVRAMRGRLTRVTVEDVALLLALIDQHVPPSGGPVERWCGNRETHAPHPGIYGGADGIGGECDGWPPELADRHGQVAGIAAALQAVDRRIVAEHPAIAAELFQPGDEQGRQDYAAALYAAGLRLAGQREDAPLDVERLARAIAVAREGTNRLVPGHPIHSPEEAAEHWPTYLVEAEAFADEYVRQGSR